MESQTPTTKRKTRTEEERRILRSQIRELSIVHGLIRAEIAEKLGIPQSTVYRYTKGMTVVTLRNRQHERHERICTLFRKGLSVSAIRHLEGACPETIHQILKARGLWQKKLDEKAAYDAEVLKYWEETRLPLTQVAAKFAIGKWRAHTILAKHPEYDGQAVKNVYLYKTIKIPDSERDAMLKLRDELNTIESIAKKFGYGRQVVAKMFQENGRAWHVRHKRGKLWVPPADAEAILQYRRSGLTLMETRAKTGYNKQTISAVCHRLGHKGLGTRKPLTAEEAKTILKLRKQKLSARNISKAINRNQRTVVDFLEKNKIPLYRKALLTKDEKEFIILARLEGAPIKHIARAINRHYGSVKRLCYKRDLGRTFKLPRNCHFKAFVRRLQGIEF